jgi:hypothetical protein
MDAPMAESNEVEGLTGALLRVASDPLQVDSLYQVLGEFCHVARNRLNCLKLSLYLARRDPQDSQREGWSRIERIYSEVEAFLERFQTVCRPMRLAPMSVDLGMLLDERRPVWDVWMADRGRSIVWDAPATPAMGVFDHARLSQGLDALALWSSQGGSAETPVHVAWGSDTGQLRLGWGDPTMRAAEEGVVPCLALPLLARVVSAHGGVLELSLRCGLDLQLVWPAQPP